MTESESFYDQFSGAAPEYEVSKKPFTPRKDETPHANRKDMSKPYKSEFQSKCDNAPASSEVMTSASTSWWRWFTRQNDNNVIAVKVNAMFNRSTVSDYDTEKARYLSEYNKLLNE